MEHKLENFFREKIRTAERQPVNWNRDITWQLIDVSLAGERKVKWYYGIAAGIVAMLALGGTYNAGTNDTAKIETINIAAYPVHPTELFEKECDLIQPPQHKVTIQKNNINYSGKYPSTLIADMNEPEEIVITEEVHETVTQEIASTEATIQVIGEVEPVIGVIIPKKEEVKIVVDKKVKIRLFRSPEKNSPEPPDTDNRNIFARIN